MRDKITFFSLIIVFSIIFLKAYLFLLPKKRLKFLNRKNIFINGVINKISSKNLILICNYLKFKNKIIKYSGKIIVYSKEFILKKLHKNQEISAYIYLKIPQNYKIPGSFNYVNYLLGKGILFTGYLASYKSIVRLADSKENFLEKYRKFLEQKIDKIRGNSDIKFLLKGIILGKKRDFPENLKNLIKNNGISHLFVISGLHVSVVFIFFLIIGRILLYKFNSFILPFLFSIPFLFFYVFITGAHYPAIRALLIVILGIIVLIIKRKKDPLRVLILIFFILLVIFPFSFLNISFQYSFIIVFAIVYFYTRFGIKRWYIITILCFLAGIPLTLYYFDGIYLKGLFINLFAVPYFTAGIIPLSSIFVFLPLDFFLKLIEINFKIFIKILKIFPDIKPLFLVKLTGFETFFVYLIVFLTAEVIRKKSIKKYAIISVCLFMLIFSFFKNHTFKNKIAILKTRKTKAIFLNYNGKSILINGGEKNTVVNFLLFKNVHRLNFFIFTEYSKIFLPSSTFIISNFKVDKIWYPDRFGVKLPDFIKIFKKRIFILNKKVDFRKAKKGYTEIKIY